MSSSLVVGWVLAAMEGVGVFGGCLQDMNFFKRRKRRRNLIRENSGQETQLQRLLEKVTGSGGQRQNIMATSSELVRV